MFEEITGGMDRLVVGGREIHGRAYVASFGFKGSDQQKKVGELSAASATGSSWPRCSRAGGNVLLLDEPTNDLDVDTLRALEDALLAFPGCAVVISHDRWFLDRIATHVLAFEGDSEVRWFEGNFSDYEADRQEAARAPTPTSRTASSTSRWSEADRVISARAVRWIAIGVCVAGIAGMIVTSALNHNGAAITFGLVTAVAILCSMVATSVASRRPPAGGRGGRPTPAPPRRREAMATTVEGQVQGLVADRRRRAGGPPAGG